MRLPPRESSQLNVVKLFFLTVEIIRSLCTLVVFCGPSGLLMLLSWIVILGFQPNDGLLAPSVFLNLILRVPASSERVTKYKLNTWNGVMILYLLQLVHKCV